MISTPSELVPAGTNLVLSQTGLSVNRFFSSKAKSHGKSFVRILAPTERQMTPRKATALKFDPQSLDWIGLRLVVVANRYVNSLYPEIAQSHGLQRDDV